MTAKLWGLNARVWLSAYLQACADSGNQAPQDISAFVPWFMDEARLTAMRARAPRPLPPNEGIDSS
jgi:transposase